MCTCLWRVEQSMWHLWHQHSWEWPDEAWKQASEEEEVADPLHEDRPDFTA